MTEICRRLACDRETGAILWNAHRTGGMTGTRYVVRRDTRGGAAPRGRCAAGATTQVPYTATYAFYR